jgi:O-antigen/teichoic acid export membrane protein/4-amino-4-deoxy-L-arabinose transferase-like glycosyltransferase/glycosyltransferase involved in cell wall biosynthesis
VTLTTEESAVREAAAAASPRPLEAGADDGAGSVAQHSALLAISAGVVGVVSYACTLLMAHLLPPADYSRYSAAVTLVGIVGIVANALVPLPLANVVRRFARRSDERRDGMAFAVLVSLIAGTGSAVVTGGITAAFAPATVAIAAALAALVLFAVAPALGWLQGELRFLRYAVVSILEVAVRLVFSVLAIAVGWGTPSALLGFVVGAMVLVCGPGALGRDLAWRPDVLRERARWAETADIALTQFVVSALVGADVVLLALVGDGSTADAGYQALSTLAKGPVYVAAGTVLVVFPLLRSVGARVDVILDAALRSFGRLALLAACVLATLPAGLTLLVLPARYADSLVLLPWLAAAGTGYAAVTVLTTVLLALRAYRRSQLALLAATLLVAAGFAAGWQLGGTYGLAIGSAAGSLTATAVLTAIAAPFLPKGIGRAAVAGVAGCAVLVAALLLARPYPVVWLAVAAVAGGLTLLSGRVSGRRTGHDESEPVPPPAAPPVDRATGKPGLRILYLATADPVGESTAGHPLNRRLARSHSVTVLAPRAPGLSAHVRDGVQYRYVGEGRRRLGRAFGFLRAVPAAVRRYDPDLVVTDLDTVGSLAALVARDRPTVGVAPPDGLGHARRSSVAVRLATRRHASVVARPDQISLLPASARGRLALDPDEREHRAARDTRPRLGSHVLYVAGDGDGDGDRKETDLLLAAWALAARRIDGDLVLCAGSRDVVDAADAAERRGIADRVRVLASATGLHRLERIAAARVVVVGTASGNAVALALDALATGTPVVAFDDPALRPVVTPDCGVLVRRFDVAALAAALTDVYTAEGRITAWAGRARQVAADRFCDLVAGHRQEVYVAAAATADDPAPASAVAPVRAAEPGRHSVPGRAWTRHRVLAVLAPLVVALGALGVRAVGATRSFELWVDEMLYAELGRSVSLGQLPNLPDGPFFLHPPGAFLLEGAVIRLFGLAGDSMTLVLQLRWLTVVLGAVTVALAFLLVRRLAGPGLAWVAAVVLAFEPFVLRNNSRVFLETPAVATALGGMLVLVVELTRGRGSPRLPVLVVAGLLLGFAVLTKDVIALYAVAPALLAALWRHTLPRRTVVVLLAAAPLPYALYLGVLLLTGHLVDWWNQKMGGFARAFGAAQDTGFNAPGSPSLVGRLLDQVAQFGSSYVLLLACPLAGLLACWSRLPERRLVGLAALCMGGFGIYSATFGTFEEQYGYPVMIAGVVAVAVVGAEYLERRPWRMPVVATVGALFTGLVVALGVRAETTVDNGFEQARVWVQANLPADASVSVTNSTGEFAFASDPRFGVWPSAPLMYANGVDYILTQSHPTSQGYGYAQPEMLEWLAANAQPAFRADGPTNGSTVVWHVNPEVIAQGAQQDVGEPSRTYETGR